MTRYSRRPVVTTGSQYTTFATCSVCRSTRRMFTQCEQCLPGFIKAWGVDTASKYPVNLYMPTIWGLSEHAVETNPNTLWDIATV